MSTPPCQERIKFEVAVFGEPAPEVTWYKGDERVEDLNDRWGLAMELAIGKELTDSKSTYVSGSRGFVMQICCLYFVPEEITICVCFC